MANRHHVSWFGLIVMGWLGYATAESQTPMADGLKTVGDLARIQSETMVLRAQIDRASAEAELAGKTNNVDMSQQANMPVVRAVYGAGGVMYATFLFVNGLTQDAKAGQVIKGGYKVVELSVDRVVLARGGHRFDAGFASSVSPQAIGTSNSMMLPGSPGNR